jgi:uncharacterized membrane protein YoaK (UPF0700 family)
VGKPQVLISADDGERLELMLVAAIATVLGIRAFLAATGYPQVGGSGLHIAHLLWGGLGLAIALIISMSVLGRRSKTLAALIGGIGFGFFIDEVGKFVTSTNDYFYKPAIALIYITFVAIALVLRFVRSRRISPNGALANALEMIADAHNTGLGEAQQTRILELLDTSEQQTPIVAALRDAVAEAPTAPAAPNPYQRLKARLAARYERIAVSRLFVRTVITFSIISLVFSLPALAVLMGVAIAERSLPESTAVSLTAVASALVTTATLIGIVQLVRRRRISGLEWLRTSMALSILIAAPVEFWTQELTALPAFILTLLAYGALGYAINRERERDDASPSG